MARRISGRPPRSKNQRIIAASAVLRSLESATPSRLSTLRLLADALLLYTRADAQPQRGSGATAHEPGARALVNSALAVLLTMPAVGGVLHRRAIALLRAAAPGAGASTMLAAAERARAQLLGLRPGGISEGEVKAEADFASAAHAVAETSRCDFAGRAVSDESVRVLLAVKGSRVIRAAAAHAVGYILESYPANFAPDVRLVDSASEALLTACAPAAITKGIHPKPGFAMLASVLVPRLASRQQQGERLMRCCANALGEVPGEEKGAWATAVVRIAIVLRGSRAKRPVRADFENRSKRVLGAGARAGPPIPSQQLFESALVTVARVTGLASARGGCMLALTAMLSAWVRSVSENQASIPARTIALLSTEAGSVAAASILRDALFVSVLPVFESSTAYTALDLLVKSSSTHGRVSDALVVDMCSVFVRRFGAQAVLESTVSGIQSRMDFDESLLDRLIELAHTALATNFAAGRLAGVRLITALASAVPEERVQLLTSALQGLRFGDLKLDSEDGIGMDDLVNLNVRGAARPNSVATGLAAVLGNAVALAALVEELTCRSKEVIPRLVLKQIAVAASNLMRPLAPASHSDRYRERVATAIRRRAGWAIFAGLGRASVVEECVEGGMPRLFDHWRDDLGHSRATTIESNPKSEGENSNEEVVLEPEEVLAETAMRTAALAALASCLEFESSPELRKYAPYIIGASAARVAMARNAPQDGSGPPLITAKTSTVMEDPLFYRASLNSKSSLADSLQPDEDNAQLSSELLILAESVQIARCSVFAPPVGTSGELCYYIALALGEDAQKALGDAAGAPAITSVVAQFLNSFNKPTAESVSIANRRLSLCTLRTEVIQRARSTASDDLTYLRTSSLFGEDLAWMCSTEGVEMPIAEETIVVSAHAISALVVEGISLPASVCEEFCTSGGFSPIFSAVIALAVTRRISSTDLHGNGRVLAMLQLLVARALKATIINNRTETGRHNSRNTTEGPWNGTCITDADLPGAVFHRMAKSETLSENRVPLFPSETPLRSVAYDCAHSRCVGLVFAARDVTSAAFRELAAKGGAFMWSGLMKSATSSLRQSLEGKNNSHLNLTTTSAFVLGTLLKIVPGKGASNEDINEGDTSGSDEVVKQAVHVLSSALERGESHVQAAAALALNDSLEEIAVSSERILAALAHAWSLDDGVDMSEGQVFKYADNIVCWETCVDRVCNRVLKTGGETDAKPEPFLSSVVPVCSIISPALAIGASAVLTSCGRYMKSFVEATAVAAAELCTELLHLSGVASYTAQAAGFRGLVQMWTARIISGKMSGSSIGPPRSPEGLLLNSLSAKKTPGLYVPIQFFSIRQPVQVGSSAGLFLEDVIYDAFLSGQQGIACGLQNAALSVVCLLLREAGRKAVCANFQRLPEILFKAAQDGLQECQNVLEILADADSLKRPKYWIGLCRAVALGGKRLNGKTPNETWDVNVHTRRLALRMMRITVTSSFVKCHCQSVVDAEAGESEAASDVVHSCVLGCLKETLSALHAAMRITPVDPSSAEEVCGALNMISARLQCKERLRLIGDTARAAFEGQWGLIALILADLLNAKSSHRVVQNIAGTACQWLLVGCFLKPDDKLKEMKCLCSALLGRELAGVTRRFEYLEKSELRGTQTVFSVLSCISQLVATRALHSQLFGSHPLDLELAQHLPILKNLLYAGIIDCNTFKKTIYREEIAKFGGAISFAGPSGDDVLQSIEQFWPWIVVGANVVSDQDGSNVVETISWIDDGSPGVEMLRLGDGNRLQVSNLCFALWLNVVEDTKQVRKMFDPSEIFLDVANYSARTSVKCMTSNDQNFALNILSGYGRSVEEIKSAGVNLFGMRDGCSNYIGLGDNLAMSQIVLASESKTATAENANKLQVEGIAGDEDLEGDSAVLEDPEDERDEEAVLDRENDEDEMAILDDDNTEEGTETSVKDNMKVREVLSTDGRLLRASLPKTDLDHLDGKTSRGGAPVPAATIAFDELDSDQEEPALPFAQHDENIAMQGRNVSSPMKMNVSFEKPEGIEEDAQADNAHSESKDEVKEPGEPFSLNGVTESEKEELKNAFEAITIAVEDDNNVKVEASVSNTTQSQELGMTAASGVKKSDSLSEEMADADGDIAKFAQSIAQSVMLDVMHDSKDDFEKIDMTAAP